MTNQQIMRTIRGVNHNPSIKWKVIKNSSNRIVITNNYDTGIKYTIEVKRDDYRETEQKLRKGIVMVVQNFDCLIKQRSTPPEEC